MAAFAVLGIGNDLLQDDGAGIHAIRQFEAVNQHVDVTAIDGGTIGLALMSELEGHQGIIVIDAMRLGTPPGTVTIHEGADMDHCLRNHSGSAHEVSISDLMDALRLSDALPPRRALIGIEPACIEWGTEPTPKIAGSIDAAVVAIQALLERWRQEISKEDAA
ncbi:MAG: hydrogenase maturation protease [Woeseiaceae bacterium]|nr:hydrogenase maturation protease [Woeseiaceae bacterium]